MNSLDHICRCPVCLETFGGKIFVCLQGHSFCESCSTHISVCPICRLPTTMCRNLQMEKAMGQLQEIKQLVKKRQSAHVKAFNCKKCKDHLNGPIYLSHDGYNYCEKCFSPVIIRNYLAEALLEKIQHKTPGENLNKVQKSQVNEESTCPIKNCDYAGSQECVQSHVLNEHPKLVTKISKRSFYTLKLKDKDQSGVKLVYYNSIVFKILYKIDIKSKRLFLNAVPLVEDGMKYKMDVTFGHVLCNKKTKPECGLIVKREQSYDRLDRIHKINISLFF